MHPHAHANLTGKRLVIFGCGYIGSAVARDALAKGMLVTALTRNVEKARALRAEGISVVEGELSGRDWHDQIPGGADFVLNSVSSGGGGVEGYRRSYHDGMASILTWATTHPVGTLAYTSSTSVYAQDDGGVVTEEVPVEARSESAAVLIETEALLQAAARRAVGRWFIFRLAGIYGPERHALLDQLRAGETQIVGRGEHRLNLIYRDDAASAIMAGFAAPPKVSSDTFNLSDGHPATREEVANRLAHLLGVPTPNFTGGTRTGRRGLVPNRIIASAKATRVLGWTPLYPDYRAGYEKILSL